ncbi:hypothetical protein AHMF7605_10315 [Adhaeribacter arboris]|uniref:Uncharacterized protein n=1 Tax=Adhaeribacter arboris TaxID=2072846 RepID=A0A2T2YEF2_9BACT|nr:hypothetical protein [Adhaeribacter arboris]PSR53882.1 hypothetical protein AHMF7605_10315 [Adhaeribacter arboris]
MATEFKYKLWAQMAKVAPSPDEQKIYRMKLAEKTKLSGRQLTTFFNLPKESKKDIPATILLQLAVLLGTTPENLVNFPLPPRTLDQEMNDPSRIAERFGMRRSSTKAPKPMHR